MERLRGLMNSSATSRASPPGGTTSGELARKTSLRGTSAGGTGAEQAPEPAREDHDTVTGTTAKPQPLSATMSAGSDGSFNVFSERPRGSVLQGGVIAAGVVDGLEDESFLEDGVDVFYRRGREWSRSARIWAAFVERKLNLETDVAKSTSKAVRQALEALEEQKLTSEGTLNTSVVALLKEHEYISQRQLDMAHKIHAEVLQPLNNRRDEHDRTRKRMIAEYEKEKRKLADNEALLARARQRYHALSQAWEKTIHDKSKEMASSYKLKLDKRTREEEEAHWRVKAAEEAYMAQLKATNAALQDLRQFSLLTNRAFDRLVHDSDAKYKQAVVRYSTLTNAFVEELPQLTRMLAANASAVNNREDVDVFVQRGSNGKIWDRKPFEFERYEMDAAAKAYLGSTNEVASASKTENSSPEANVALHKFKKTVQPSVCSHCGNVVFTGLVCTECRAVCHKACVEKLKVHCEKAVVQAPRSLSVIGVSLAKQPRSMDHPDIPLLVTTCVRAIVLRGVEAEGLYRVAGIKSSMERLFSLFEEHGHQPGTVDTAYEPDIHVIAGCLKLFFRQLPEPLVPYEQYAQVVQCASRSKGAVNLEELSRLLSLFPAVNYETLAYVMRHLSFVTQFAEVNKMRASNLAIVFGPSLLRTELTDKDPVAAFAENTIQCDVIETLIESCSTIFSRADRLRGKDYADVLKAENDLRPTSRLGTSYTSLSEMAAPPASSSVTSPASNAEAPPQAVEDDDDIDEFELGQIAARSRQRAMEEMRRQTTSDPSITEANPAVRDSEANQGPAAPASGHTPASASSAGTEASASTTPAKSDEAQKLPVTKTKVTKTKKTAKETGTVSNAGSTEASSSEANQSAGVATKEMSSSSDKEQNTDASSAAVDTAAGDVGEADASNPAAASETAAIVDATSQN